MLSYPKIQLARNYQRRDDAVRLASEDAESVIAEELRAALKHGRRTVPIEHLVEAIKQRNYHAAVRKVDFAGLVDAVRGSFQAIVEAYRAGALIGAKAIRVAKIAKDASGSDYLPSRNQFAFDLFADDVLAALKEYQAKLILGLTADSKQVVYNAVVEGVRLGLSPVEIAGTIRNVIGLTDRQAKAVMSYERMLRESDPEALARSLRDTKFDPEVKAAVTAAREEGKPLGSDRIAVMVEAYVERSLDYRAAMIARTESVRAVNMGLRDAYKQAVQRGVFPAEAITLYWQVALDEKLCPICAAIPDMNKTGVRIEGEFRTPAGTTDHPPQHPNCRCSLKIVTNLDMLASPVQNTRVELV